MCLKLCTAASSFISPVDLEVGIIIGINMYPTQQTAHTIFNQVLQQAAPLRPEDVGPSQTAISPNDTQVGDPMLHQVVSSPEAPLSRGESLAAGTANDRASLHVNKACEKASQYHGGNQRADWMGLAVGSVDPLGQSLKRNRIW